MVCCGDICLLLWLSAWVDAVWDLEFTEKKPLDDLAEEELAAGRDEAFRALYQCLLLHATDQQHSADRDGASAVRTERNETHLSVYWQLNVQYENEFKF